MGQQVSPWARVHRGRIAVLTLGRFPQRQALEADDDIVVVAVVPTADQIRRTLARTPADIALLQLQEPREPVYEVSRYVTREHADMDVVVWDAPFAAEILLDAIEAGIRGYSPRGATEEQLRRVVRAVAGGDPAIPRRLVGGMLDLLTQRRIQREEALRRLWRLTSRERAILSLLTEARSNEAIGKTLHISPQTVRKHVQHVFTKLGVHSRLEAVTFVHRHGVGDELAA